MGIPARRIVEPCSKSKKIEKGREVESTYASTPARSPWVTYSMSLGMWKRGKVRSIAFVTSKKDLRVRMVTRTPSNLVVLVCAETFTELSALVIGMYLSFKF